MTPAPGIFFEDRFFKYSDLLGDVFGLREQISPNSRISLTNPNALELLAVILSLGSHVDEICIFPPELKIKDRPREKEIHFDESEFQKFYLNKIKSPKETYTQSERLAGEETKITLFSSGTSGTPKSSTHFLQHLLHQFDYQRMSDAAITWGLLYQTPRMATIQLLLNSFVRNESIVCMSNQTNLKEKIDAFSMHDVNALSGTPSMFRYLKQFDGFQRLPLIQITLGGELVDQEILNALKTFFPAARITHIYASTEVGFGFAISDGLSGFPSSYFSRDFKRFKLESINDELVFTFPSDEKNQEGHSIFSGDIIKQEGERIFFVGRQTSMVNVGGLKVFPEEVEEIIRRLPGVSDAHVYSVKSSQMGEILMARIICDATIKPASIRFQLKEHLPPHKVPAMVEIVEELHIGPNGKISRL